MLHQHFVFTGSFDKQKAAFFGDLMQERIEDDYSEFLKIAMKMR